MGASRVNMKPCPHFKNKGKNPSTSKQKGMGAGDGETIRNSSLDDLDIDSG